QNRSSLPGTSQYPSRSPPTDTPLPLRFAACQIHQPIFDREDWERTLQLRVTAACLLRPSFVNKRPKSTTTPDQLFFPKKLAQKTMQRGIWPCVSPGRFDGSVAC